MRRGVILLGLHGMVEIPEGGEAGQKDFIRPLSWNRKNILWMKEHFW